jgi:uncharacterized protein (DUF488 family)
MLGYDARSLSETLELIKSSGSRSVADIRRWAKSRRRPEYSSDNLNRVFRENNINYVHVPTLGGYRRFGVDVADRGLFNCFESESFRAYATYLLSSPQAMRGLEILWYLIPGGLTVLCTERLPWRCHRKIVADWLVLHGIRVYHVLDSERVLEHRGTKCIGEMARLLGVRWGLDGLLS